MNITNVRINLINRPQFKLKGVAAITIDDCFVVHDIKIVDSGETLFIAMPSKKCSDGTFKDIAHPINPETRKLLSDVILNAYKIELERESQNTIASTEE